ncbi:transposase [Streptomyces sp. R44]|uniref:Transposase n=1 Tax=Streptomyces sp. R44 TaxID=3238633 RepID=A0AB39T8L4_9ACTN
MDCARSGSEHHLIVDRHGTPLAVHPHRRQPARRHPAPAAAGRRPIDARPAGRPRRKPRRLYADRGYDLDKYRRLLGKRGIKPPITRRGVAHGSGLGGALGGRARLRLAAPVQTAPHPVRTTRRSP